MMKKNKKILITGAAGFIGSHLAEFFVSKGFKVIAFDRYNSFNTFGWLDFSHLKNRIELIFGDIRDYDSVNRAIKKCDVVIHLAALIGIPYSYESPAAYLKTNVEGTYNILESVKNNKISQAIITSTSETYGSAQSKKINEDHPYNAQSPYAATKISADQLSLSYYKSFNTPVKIIRPFNTYGPRQSSRAIIPTIISQSLTSNSIVLGNIDTSRDLTYVSDTCRGFYEIFKCKKLIGEVVNVGSDNEISIKNIVNDLRKITNQKLKIKIDKKRLRPKKSEVLRLRCNSDKLFRYTGWRPSITFKQGLQKTYQWFSSKENKKFYKDRKYSI